jgi:hypothetical protein
MFEFISQKQEESGIESGRNSSRIKSSRKRKLRQSPETGSSKVSKQENTQNTSKKAKPDFLRTIPGTKMLISKIHKFEISLKLIIFQERYEPESTKSTESDKLDSQTNTRRRQESTDKRARRSQAARTDSEGAKRKRPRNGEAIGSRKRRSPR